MSYQSIYNTFLSFCLFLFSFSFSIQSQDTDQSSTRVFVPAGRVVIFPDSIISVKQDTFLTVPQGANYRIEEVSNHKNSVFYDSLKQKADKNSLTKTLVDAFVVTQADFQSDSTDFQKSEVNFIPFAGKKIKNIRIKQVRIMAGSVYDTTLVQETRFSGYLNSFHFSTRKHILYDNLLFTEGDRINPYELADNERLLRNLPYIQDANIVVVPVAGNEDEANIIVITEDRFSIGFTPTIIDQNNFRFELFEKNLLGFGTELRYKYLYNSNEDPLRGNELRYNLTNIRGTFVSGFVEYASNFGEELLRMNLKKDFITPQTRYGGALELGKSSTFHREENEDALLKTPFSFKYLDIWLGRSVLMVSPYDRKNFILAARYIINDFTDRPSVSPDSNFIFHDSRFLLGSISYRKIEYFKSSLILSFGITEDVPVGYLIQFNWGLEKEEFADKPYFGFTLTGARVWDGFGYLGSTFSFGGFYHNKRFQEGMVRFIPTYFSPLATIGKFRFRQLVKLEYNYGISRLPGEIIFLKDNIRGLGTELFGTRKLAFNLESVFFSPWNLLGFRFALFGFSDLGFISDEDRLLQSSNFFSTVGMGCRIRNESLVFKTIQIRLAYFPRTPGDLNHWEIDFSSRERFGFQMFDIGKPQVIAFE